MRLRLFARLWLLAGVAFCALSAPVKALADGAPEAADASNGGSPYKVRWALDLSILAGAGLFWGGSTLLLDKLVDPTCPCDSSEINRFDRFAVDLHSATAKTTSDILLGTLVALPLALDAVDVGLDENASAVGFAADAVILGQAILVSGALNQVAKLVVHRPRPLIYDQPADAAALRKNDNYLSFYSAHTSTAFAASLAYATTFSLRHPRSKWRPFVYGAAVAAGATTGLLRILAGKHFPTDVLVGAVTGSAVGLGLPRLHQRDSAGGGALAFIAPVSGGAVLVMAAGFD